DRSVVGHLPRVLHALAVPHAGGGRLARVASPARGGLRLLRGILRAPAALRLGGLRLPPHAPRRRDPAARAAHRARTAGSALRVLRPLLQDRRGRRRAGTVLRAPALVARPRDPRRDARHRARASARPSLRGRRPDRGHHGRGAQRARIDRRGWPRPPAGHGRRPRALPGSRGHHARGFPHRLRRGGRRRRDHGDRAHSQPARARPRGATREGRLPTRPLAHRFRPRRARLARPHRGGRAALGGRRHVLQGLHLHDARRARLRPRLALETCPQYLYLREDELRAYSAFRKFTPPARIRFDADADAMWRRVAQGPITHVSSDHAPATRAQKTEGSIWEAHFGLPGVETTLGLLLNGVAEGRLGLERVVELVADAPARLYGLWPRKGSLEVGADADI